MGFIPDICAHNKQLWQWAGINLGEYNCMMLQKSLSKLAASSGASNLRLWGKINGTDRDYFVAEGSAEGAGEEGAEERPADFEPRGAPGVNQFAYWVCNSPDENKWTALPDLLPADLAASRSIKVRLSGNLERQIITNPFFDKSEKTLLRAQIARISQSTTLVPKGVYRLNEDDKNVIEENLPEEGPVPVPSTQAMASPHNWVHYQRSILQCNRLTIMEPEPVDEEDPEVTKAKAEARDPQEALLKSIAADSKVKGGAPSWSVRCYGDQSVYGAADPKLPDLHYGVVVVRSNNWPGAHTFFSAGQWSQLYLGDGLKFEERTYYPVCPPTLCADPVERATHEEPNPTAAFLQKKAEAEAAAANAAPEE